jgi:uncharacterized protein YukJ
MSTPPLPGGIRLPETSRGGGSTGVPNYSVVKGRPQAGRVFPPKDPTRDQPHYHIHLVAGTSHFDVAVNILSSDQSQVLFRVDTQFQPPHAAELTGLQPGVHAIGSAGSGGLGLDFIRQNLVTRDQMSLLDVNTAVRSNARMELVLALAETTPLHGSIDALVQSAINEPNAEVYAFRSGFRNGGSNPFFGFSPDTGAHDIHMNQGNPSNGGFAKDNGIYQDGALFVSFPSQSTWQAVFIAFQTQSWHTDNHGRPA